MKIKGIIDEDLVNYKVPSMYIAFPYCSFKCDKENGCQLCQNARLAQETNIEITKEKLIERYLDNDLTHAIVLSGLEPFDTYEDVKSLIKEFRKYTNDEIVIYTGYNEDEVKNKTALLSKNFSIPINGISTSSTNEVTILPKAPPMITPTAMSITLPFMANSLNSLTNPIVLNF